MAINLRDEVRLIVDPMFLQLREAIYGPGVTYANFIPLSSLPPTVVNGDLDELVGDYGYIKTIQVYSGGVFKGDVTELNFLNASVIVTGNRANITISGRGIIDAGVNGNTPYSNVGHLDFQMAGGTQAGWSSSYDSNLNKATIVFDLSSHQNFKGSYSDYGHVRAGSGILVTDGTMSIDPTVIPSGFVNPMTSLGDIVYGGSSGTPLRRGIGTELQVLTVSGGLPTWQSAQTVIGSGVAPTNAKYVTTEAHAGLLNEIVIPGLAGHADVLSYGGGGTEYDFDSGVSPFTWDTTPGVVDVNTTVKSHLHVEATGTGSSVWLAWVAWAPAGNFDLRAKVSLGNEHANNTSVGLQVYNSDNSRRLLCYLHRRVRGGFGSNAFTYNGSYSEVAGISADGQNYRYLRIKREASDVIRFYQSSDGITWEFIGTTTFSITVARLGLYIDSGGTVATHVNVDWIRADV